jgi:hypothetical protein
MAFVSVLPENVEQISRADIGIIISITLCIFFGFEMTIARSLIAYFVFFSLSFLFYGIAYYICYFTSKKKIASQPLKIIDQQNINLEQVKSMIIVAKEKKLNSFMFFVLPPFPILYIFSMAGMQSFSPDIYSLFHIPDIRAN